MIESFAVPGFMESTHSGSTPGSLDVNQKQDDDSTTGLYESITKFVLMAGLALLMICYSPRRILAFEHPFSCFFSLLFVLFVSKLNFLYKHRLRINVDPEHS